MCFEEGADGTAAKRVPLPSLQGPTIRACTELNQRLVMTR